MKLNYAQEKCKKKLPELPDNRTCLAFSLVSVQKVIEVCSELLMKS